MTTTPYEASIVTALRLIQEQHGYLTREALEQYARASKTPLYRLQSVASFFPHFRLSEPPRVTVRVCRDMACHLKGSRDILTKLAAFAGDDVHVEGVSCLGRCDRPPAACIEVHEARGSAGRNGTHDAERYFLGRSLADLQRVIDHFKSGDGPEPRADRDEDRPFEPGQWQIDPYGKEKSTYAGVKKAVEARDKALDFATGLLREQCRFSETEIERFRRAAVEGSPVDEVRDERVHAVVKAWRTGSEWADVVLAELDDADLRGLGGAGVPATDKWRDVRAAIYKARERDDDDDRAFVIVNADESEPGTFKDRELLLRCPHLIVEGLILAALVTDATQGFVYIRHEYAEQIDAVRREIDRAAELGVCGPDAPVLGRPLFLSVFVSPGGYICGEQTALLEAMSDRRGEPRNIPPKPETNGLDDRPTLVSNVETYAWVPYVWSKGGAAYADLGVKPWEGRRFFSVCGDVVRPGVYEVPMGLTLRKLIYDDAYCQGVTGGAKLKAIAPSGPSGGFLPARLTAGAGLRLDDRNEGAWRALAKRQGFDPSVMELDVLDLELELALFRKLSPTAMLGAGIVVYAEHRDMAKQAVNAIEFFRNESCGKCVPCRIGSQKLAALGGKLLDGAISAERWKTELKPMVEELGEAMSQASICGLGRSVPTALKCATEYFGSDVAPYLGRTPGEGRR